MKSAVNRSRTADRRAINRSAHFLQRSDEDRFAATAIAHSDLLSLIRRTAR
jgi:hypothetical protein